MRILGVDPGIGRMGWGVIEVQSAKCKVQSFGCIETSMVLRLDQRLQAIYERVTVLLEEYKPDAMAIEELFFNTNAKTALVVGQARGVVLLAAAQRKLPIGVYMPLQVKLAVTGYGNAEKKQVEKMVMTLLKLSKKPKYDDASDALAVALTHAFSAKYPKAETKQKNFLDLGGTVTPKKKPEEFNRIRKAVMKHVAEEAAEK